MRRWRPSERPVLADANGRFVIRNLRNGTYDLEAEGLKGTHRGTLEKVATGSDVTVTLEPLAGITGKVLSKGVPVKDYLIRLQGPSWRRTHVVNEEGRYRLNRLDPGEYEISITAPEGRASGEVEVKPNQTATKDFTLVAFGSVRGVVKDAATGEPMPDLAAIAYAEKGSDLGSQAMDIMTGQGPTTDEEGRFRVGRLGAGKGTLMIIDADQAGFEIVASKDFTLEAGEDLDLGELQGQTVNTVPKEERGELGMSLSAADWAGRPLAKDEKVEDDPPDGLVAEAEHLWVSSVEEGGAAAAAGLEVGDRIVAVGGAQVAAVGPRVAQAMLSPRRIRAGQPIDMVIDRGGNQNAVTITPLPAGSGDSE
jgi:hypothetical protein